MAIGHAFAFECECNKLVVFAADGFTSTEYSEFDTEEFADHCAALDIALDSDGFPVNSYGFCNWCELTVN
jgi:hypothetical protein